MDIGSSHDGKKQTYIGDGLEGNTVIVHFDHAGVRFDVVDDAVDGTPLTIMTRSSRHTAACQTLSSR
jgi:hypothetical protein